VFCGSAYVYSPFHLHEELGTDMVRPYPDVDPWFGHYTDTVRVQMQIPRST
jgi:hypothetical protein